jgi:hypothetical protein
MANRIRFIHPVSFYMLLFSESLCEPSSSALMAMHDFTRFLPSGLRSLYNNASFLIALLCCIYPGLVVHYNNGALRIS